MQILKFPDKRLFIKCNPVTVFGEELKIILEAMYSLMESNNGIGLASNQVGHFFYMFTMKGPEEEKLFLINPRVKSRSAAPANIKEGCLSAPGEFIVRPDRVLWVEVEFVDENGKHATRVFKGLHAVCVEHEIEHLEGKGFMESSYLNKKERTKLAKKWGLK